MLSRHYTCASLKFFHDKKGCNSQFLPLAMMLKVCQSLILGKFFKVRKFYVQCILSSCKREIVSTIFLLKLS